MTTNNDKILKVLKTKKELITTTELSNETSIDIKNITRYLKPLENKGLIVRKTIQNGKIRVVMIELSKEINKPKLIPPKPPIIKQPPKREIKEFTLDNTLDFLHNDLDYRRSFVKLFREMIPEAFKGINTRTTKENMDLEFTQKASIINENLNVLKNMQTPLLNEMRNENKLFKNQKAKHNT